MRLLQVETCLGVCSGVLFLEIGTFLALYAHIGRKVKALIYKYKRYTIFSSAGVKFFAVIKPTLSVNFSITFTTTQPTLPHYHDLINFDKINYKGCLNQELWPP
jgi:hypothetical protein